MITTPNARARARARAATRRSGAGDIVNAAEHVLAETS